MAVCRVLPPGILKHGDTMWSFRLAAYAVRSFREYVR
jgi:hypothetical protein